MQLSWKEKILSELFLEFSKFRFNFEHFQKKHDPHSWYILNLRSLKNVNRSIPKKSCFRGPFDKLHGKLVETLFKAKRQHLYHIYWSLWMQFRLKNSIWVICKMLGLFVNHWPPIISINFLTKGIYSNIFRCNYLRQDKHFLNFFCIF